MPEIRTRRGGVIRCPTGEARITIGGELKVPYCIHAVGPNYRVAMRTRGLTMDACDALVSAAYSSALGCAQQYELKSVGFSLISSGVFRGDQTLERVLSAGLRGVVAGAYLGLEEVHLIAFDAEELAALLEVCDEMFGTEKRCGMDSSTLVPKS